MTFWILTEDTDNVIVRGTVRSAKGDHPNMTEGQDPHKLYDAMMEADWSPVTSSGEIVPSMNNPIKMEDGIPRIQPVYINPTDLIGTMVHLEGKPRGRVVEASR